MKYGTHEEERCQYICNDRAVILVVHSSRSRGELVNTIRCILTNNMVAQKLHKPPGNERGKQDGCINISSDSDEYY